MDHKAPLLTGNMINWNQVFYFSEIARVGSIKVAAEQLSLSPSTLSEHLSELEDDLRVRLFHREHRQLRLTREGARLFQHAKQMFETGKRLIDVLSPIPLGCYPVSVGLVPGASFRAAYQLIGRYVRDFSPGAMRLFHYNHDSLEEALLEARLDFGFTDRMAERKNVSQRLLHSAELRFFVARDLAHRGLSDLAAELPILICKSDMISQSPVEKIIEDTGLGPVTVIASEFPSLIESLCETGAGIAVMSDMHVSKTGSTLKALPLPRNLPRLTEKLYVAWARDAESSEVVDRLRQLLDSAGDEDFDC